MPRTVSTGGSEHQPIRRKADALIGMRSHKPYFPYTSPLILEITMLSDLNTLPASAPLAAIAWAYLITNSARIITYLPQIQAVWRSTDGARAISLWTWGSWSVSHITALLYGVLVIEDGFFSLITGIAAWRRQTARQRGPVIDASA